jgi:hypothetical protein
MPEDNIYDALGASEPAQTVSPSVSDGYWLMLAPLPAGTHDINFGGTTTATTPSFTLDATYHLTVQAATAIPLPPAAWSGAAAALLASVPAALKLRRR